MPLIIAGVLTLFVIFYFVLKAIRKELAKPGPSPYRVAKVVYNSGTVKYFAQRLFLEDSYINIYSNDKGDNTIDEAVVHIERYHGSLEKSCEGVKDVHL